LKAITRQKALLQIEEMLEKASTIFLVGCGTCATMCRTGGKDEVAAMEAALAAMGKTVAGSVVVPTVCDALDREALAGNAGAVEQADCVLVMSCAFGVQMMGLYTAKPVYPALDTLFMGQEMSPGTFSEVCVQCGECVLGWTGGICPITSCPKGLLNGPCGGARQGKCEVSAARDCAWEAIYRRLRQQGRLDLLMKRRALRDFSASLKPGAYLVE
jgi:ferredoxin